MNVTQRLARRNKAATALSVSLSALLPYGASRAADADQSTSLETIVVTAQKREQAAIDVPASVTALNASQLAHDGLQRLEDYQAQVPGLSITANGGSMQVTLRGISTGLSQSAPTTSIYIDEAPIGSANAYTAGAGQAPDLDPYDLSRIEVLKGPQATLFGAGAMGGVLHYVTKGPDFDRFTGSVTLGGDSVEDGGYGHLERVSVNAPFGNNTMALRMSAFDRSEAGFTDNILSGEKNVNSSHTYGGRVDYGWKLSPDWSMDLWAMTQRFSTNGGNGYDVNGSTLQPFYGKYEYQAILGSGSVAHLDVGNLTVHGKLGGVNLVSSSTAQISDNFAHSDGTPAYGVFAALLGNPGLAVLTKIHEHTQRLSQELRAQSTALDGKLDYEGGLYFTHEDDENRIPDFGAYTLPSLTPATIVYPSPPFPPGVPVPNGIVQAKIDSTYRDISVFGNATLAITRQFDIQAGLRFSDNKQTFDQQYSGLITLIAGSAALMNSSTHHNTNYLVTLRYKPSESNTFYARVADGYRPGGPSAATPAVTAATNNGPTVGPDSLTSVEFGWKSVMLDGRLSLDTALFHTNWKDIQIQTSALGDNFFVNGGTAVSQGAEAALLFAPITRLTLRADVGYTDAHLTEDTGKALVNVGTPAQSPLGRDGDRLPFIPKLTGSVGASYSWPLNAEWKADIGSSVNYVGYRKADYSGIGAVDVPAYTTVHLNAGIETTAWRLSAYVRNLNNSDGIIYLGNKGIAPHLPGVPYTAGVIRPRTIGLELSYRF